MRKSSRTKRQVQKDLGLERAPSRRLMTLIADAGDGDIVEGPRPGRGSRPYTPREIEDSVIAGTIGELLAAMRREAGQSLREAAKAASVSAARIQQIERSQNIELATLVRLASAAGYDVSITLSPLRRGRPTLSAALGRARAQ